MELITQNGQKTVVIKPASFQDAINLKKAVAKCLQEADIIKDLDTMNVELTSLINTISSLLFTAEMSGAFEHNVFECLKVCFIEENGIKNKITPQLFDEKPELREDYYEIVMKCVEVNLRPFFKSLVTEFKTRLSRMTKDQQSELPPAMKDL